MFIFTQQTKIKHNMAAKHRNKVKRRHKDWTLRGAKNANIHNVKFSKFRQ